MFFIKSNFKIFFVSLICFLNLITLSDQTPQTPMNKGYYHFFTGAITYHFFDFKEDSLKFKKGIADHGKLIAHPFFGAEKAYTNGEETKSQSIFLFNDSLGSPSLGYQNGTFTALSEYAEAGYFWSIYFIHQSVWERNGIDLPIRIKLGRSIAAVPLVGIRQSFHFKITQKNYLKFNFAITPNTGTFLIGATYPF